MPPRRNCEPARHHSPLPESAARPPDPDLWPQPFPLLTVQFAQVRLQCVRHLPAHHGWNPLPVIAIAEPRRVHAPAPQLLSQPAPVIQIIAQPHRASVFIERRFLRRPDWYQGHSHNDSKPMNRLNRFPKTGWHQSTGWE